MFFLSVLSIRRRLQMEDVEAYEMIKGPSKGTQIQSKEYLKTSQHLATLSVDPPVVVILIGNMMISHRIWR